MAELFILPIVGALIGWLTNLLAVRLIFRPYVAVKVPLIGLEIIGLVPKRRAEIAVSVGRLIEEELFTSTELLHELLNSEMKNEIIESVLIRLEERVSQKLPFFLQGLKSGLFEGLKEPIRREIGSFLDEYVDKLQERAKTFPVAQIVESKINQLSLPQLEALILSIAKKELRHIEILGGVLGFIIGVFQVLLLQIL
jgi:uncharacterized membrane protein YheB (UPF0754 family)